MTTTKAAKPTANETAVKVATRLYEARDTMRGLWPEGYQHEIGEHQKVLRAAMERHQCGALAALKTCLKVMIEPSFTRG